jgi:hypothetical protein
MCYLKYLNKILFHKISFFELCIFHRFYSLIFGVDVNPKISRYLFNDPTI